MPAITKSNKLITEAIELVPVSAFSSVVSEISEIRPTGDRRRSVTEIKQTPCSLAHSATFNVSFAYLGKEKQLMQTC